MTLKTLKNEIKIKNIIIIFFSVLLTSFLSKDISKYTREGVLLCFNTIVGSVFPFMILTDYIVSEISINDRVKAVFEKFFKINGNAAVAFICGAICGMPIGVKITDKLFSDGIINKDEYERLIGFVNNASPAFIISGIGASMRNSIEAGVLIYTGMILSSVISGIVFGIGHVPSQNCKLPTGNIFSFAKSVKESTVATLNVCGFVTLFSIICGIVGMLLKNSQLGYLVFPFLEISNAAKIFVNATDLSTSASLALTAFSVSFSGISVHMQVKSFITSQEVSMKRYYIMKLFSGVFSAIFTIVMLSIK